MRGGKSVNEPVSDIFFTDLELSSAKLDQGIEDCAPSDSFIIEIVVKVAGTDTVFRQSQRSLEGIPDGECPLTDQLAKAIFSPFLVGRRHDRDVC
jgi:hypothetical protein